MREIYIGVANNTWPFSRGLVVESLINAGADEEQAAAAARRVELELRQATEEVVSPEALQKLMVQVAQQLLSAEVAQQAAQQVPTFADILVLAKKGVRPFSRGVLARALEDVGLSGLDAYTTASLLDVQLRQQGVRQLSSDELYERTEQMLAQRYGEHYRLAYRYLRDNRGRLGVMGERDRPPAPFSKGILVQSLLAAGVAPDLARKVARMTQRDLRGQEDRLIRRRDIRTRVETLLSHEVGPHISARYRLLRVIRRPPRPIIVLLGGVSGTGKSVLAAEVAYRLGIARVVSTDSIREVMRAVVSPALLPTLHASTFSAWEALVPPGQSIPAHPSKTALLAGFREQVQQVSVGLNAVVERSVQESTSLVLEGVHLVPGYLRIETYQPAIVISMMVTLPDEQEHRRHFEFRDEQTLASRPMHRYMRYFKEIRLMQTELETLARQQPVPLLNGLTLDESADQAVNVVLRAVMSALSLDEKRSLLGDEYAETTLL